MMKSIKCECALFKFTFKVGPLPKIKCSKYSNNITLWQWTEQTGKPKNILSKFEEVGMNRDHSLNNENCFSCETNGKVHQNRIAPRSRPIYPTANFMELSFSCHILCLWFRIFFSFNNSIRYSVNQIR